MRKMKGRGPHNRKEKHLAGNKTFKVTNNLRDEEKIIHGITGWKGWPYKFIEI